MAGVENMSHGQPKTANSHQLGILDSYNGGYQLFIRNNPARYSNYAGPSRPFRFPWPTNGAVLMALSFSISERSIKNNNGFLYVDINK